MPGHRPGGLFRRVPRNVLQGRDVAAVTRKVLAGNVGAVIAKLRSTPVERSLDVWEETDRPPAHWLSIPVVQRRWAELVSGRPDVRFVDHVAGVHLAGRTGLRALSMGCGTAVGELQWAATGRFERIDGFDLAEQPVVEARLQAAELGLDHVFDAVVADIADVAMPPEHYDVVLVEHALHHMAPMTEVVARVHDTLRPGGLLCLDEYVGPTQFQWTDRQLEAAEALLLLLPERLRRLPDGSTRRTVVRPSLARMVLTDPSEAIESARIVPAVQDRFEVLEARGYGGTLLHLVFADISQHFLDESDAEAMRFLATAIDVEDALLATGELRHDFATIIARRTP